MENSDFDEPDHLAFFRDKNATNLFAKIDYFLRSGVHIQRKYPSPAGIFRFIEKNYESLSLFYKEFYGVILVSDGDGFKRYFYLDFLSGSRGNISSEYREVLKADFVIIGLLFYKLFKIDGNIGLNKLSDFKALLFTEYPEEKELLSQRLNDSQSSYGTEYSDERIYTVIKSAFDKFSKLGWICWEDGVKDQFLLLPSYERLLKLYESEILNIDELAKVFANDD